MAKQPVIGKCKLCLKTKQLQKSHFIPAAMYKYIIRGALGAEPVVVGRRITSTTSQQVRDHLLCSDCEDLFNKNGERYTLKWVWNGKDFPLLDRLKLALHKRESNQYLLFSGDRVGLDTDQFAYFGLSVLWRSAVHIWNTPLGGKSNKMDLGKFEEPIRRFLLGAPFPNDVYIHLTVCSDAPSRQLFYMPQKVSNMPIVAFSFLTLGMHFMIYTMKTQSVALRDTSCAGPDRTILMRDCAQKAMEAYQQFSGSRPVGKIAKAMKRDQ